MAAAVSLGVSGDIASKEGQNLATELNGRKYLGKYLLPKPSEKAETTRLGIAHRMWEITLDGELHLAPISESKPPEYVLDIGTGTGNWAIDFAIRYPSCHVIGVDIAEVEAKEVPSNCTFIVANALKDDWGFAKHPFDYVHLRASAAWLKSPPDLMRKALAHLRPGGYIEFQDINNQTADDASMENTALQALWDAANAFTESNNARWDKQTLFAQWLSEEGYVGVQEKVFKWPSNPHSVTDEKGQALGTLFTEQTRTGLLEAVFARVCIEGSGWTQEKFTDVVERAKKEYASPEYHGYSPIHFVYGQKP